MQDYIRADEGVPAPAPLEAPAFNAFRVTGVWSDGLDVSETHVQWVTAQDFINELVGVDCIVKITIEKVTV